MAQGTCSIDGCGQPIRCKRLCKTHYRRERYDARRDIERASHAVWREAHLEQRHSDFADWYRAHRTPEFMEAKRGYASARYAANRESIRATDRARLAAKVASETPEQREERLARRRARYAANSDHYRAKHLDYTHRRNALKRGSPAGEVDFIAVLAEHGMTCHICGDEIADRTDLHFDHVIPLSRGGAHAADNIRPAHALCNMRKGSRLI